MTYPYLIEENCQAIDYGISDSSYHLEGNEEFDKFGKKFVEDRLVRLYQIIEIIAKYKDLFKKFWVHYECYVFWVNRRVLKQSPCSEEERNNYIFNYGHILRIKFDYFYEKYVSANIPDLFYLKKELNSNLMEQIMNRI